MKTKIEKLLKLYPEMVRERDCITNQLAHFRGVSAEEVIESMYTPRMDGERVQSSNLSDKTAQIALTYEERRERINMDWYQHLENRLQIVSDQISFIESAICALPSHLSGMLWDMVVEGLTWGALARKYNTCRSNIGKMRKKAVFMMETLYEKQIQEIEKYMLG